MTARTLTFTAVESSGRTWLELVISLKIRSSQKKKNPADIESETRLKNLHHVPICTHFICAYFIHDTYTFTQTLQINVIYAHSR